VWRIDGTREFLIVRDLLVLEGYLILRIPKDA
jgi:hypothetical protein